MPFWSAYWLKHVMNSFMIFSSSAIAKHITTFGNSTLQNDWLWLAIVCEVHNSIWNKRNRNQILFMHTLPMSFTGSYTKVEPNFPRQNNQMA